MKKMIQSSNKYYLLKRIANKNLMVYKMYFFFYFAALGAFLPLYPVYLNEVMAFPNDKVGIILSINPLTSILFQPLWGLINAKFNLDKKLVMFSLIMVNAAVAGIIIANYFPFIVLFTFLYGLFVSSIGPIQDGLTVLFTNRYGFKYGNVRIWGSVGYATASLLVGMLVTIGDYNIVIYAMTTFIIIALLCFIQLKQTRKLRINKQIYKQNNLKNVLRNKQYLLFLLFSALGIGIVSATGNFFLIKLSSLGANASQIGLISSIQVVSEIITMMLILKFNHKFSDLRFITISIVIHIPVYIIYILSDNVYLLMGSLILRGINQGMFIPVILSFISSLVSPQQLSIGIILYSALAIGLTGYITTFGGGYISKFFGMEVLYVMLMCLVILSLFVISIFNTAKIHVR
jgi:MFS transporter, PPP family, 3-phenylpropionic acid transporter